MRFSPERKFSVKSSDSFKEFELKSAKSFEIQLDSKLCILVNPKDLVQPKPQPLSKLAPKSYNKLILSKVKEDKNENMKSFVIESNESDSDLGLSLSE